MSDEYIKGKLTFKSEFVLTPQDEVLFSRLNPLFVAPTKVRSKNYSHLVDPAIYYSKHPKHVSEQEKVTKRFIRGLKEDVAGEVLLATLEQYITKDRHAEMMNNFRDELRLALQNRIEAARRAGAHDTQIAMQRGNL